MKMWQAMVKSMLGWCRSKAEHAPLPRPCWLQLTGPVLDKPCRGIIHLSCSKQVLVRSAQNQLRR
eukprot:2764070-Amphidinium_carterae.1